MLFEGSWRESSNHFLLIALSWLSGAVILTAFAKGFGILVLPGIFAIMFVAEYFEARRIREASRRSQISPERARDFIIRLFGGETRE